MRKRVYLNAPFNMIDIPIAYALLLDSMDLTLGWLPVVREVVDLVQAFGAYLIFKDVKYALVPGATELLLPAGFDLFPTFTAGVIADEAGKW